MADSKQFKLEIQFTELQLPRPIDPSTLGLVVTVGSNTHQLSFQSISYITIPSFSPDGVMNLELRDEALLATSSVQLGRLCDKTITGNFEKWVKFEPEKGVGLEGPKGVKVKLVGVLGNSRRSISPNKARPKNIGVSPLKIRGKCNYLKKLNSVEDAEKDIHDIVVRVRTRLGAEYEQLIEDGIRSPARSPGRSPGKSPLRKRQEDENNLDMAEPYLELPSRFELNIEQLSSSEPHLLRNIAIGLCQKIRVMKAQVEEYEAIQEVVVNFDSPMEELAQSMTETREQLGQEQIFIDGVITQVSGENLKLEEAIASVDSQIKALEEEIGNVKEQAEHFKNENEKNKIDGENVEKEIKRIAKLKKQIEKDDGERETMISSYQAILTGYADPHLANDLVKIEEERVAMLSQLNSQTSLLDHANIENLQLQAQIEITQAELISQEDQKSRNITLNAQNNSYAQISAELEKAYQDLNALKEININESMNHSRKIEIDIRDYQNSQPALEQELQSKQQQIADYLGNLEEFRKHLEDIETLLKNDEGIYDQYRDFKLQFDAEVKIQEELLKELSYFSDLVFMQAQAGLLTNRLYRRLEDMLEEKEYQKGSMQKMIDDIKRSKPAYIAKQGDLVDVALAKYLNTRENTMDVNFVRTDKEKYVFGTKNVEIKKEGEGLFVYFEGKKLGIEEFTDGYNTIEKEKLEDQAELKKLNSMGEKKSAIFGTVIDMSSKKEGRSPGLGSKSPQRGMTALPSRESPTRKRTLL
ncbi:unnamed protein product [Blepharisma stoltei]|uniref:Uncharacterized protein n=1 Tax=Blepharisma stoltei TaxID=1481888 RepID=A0AAU9JXF9_9CILI|nr:unnamed protein product [Blepharisma stoltei]